MKKTKQLLVTLFAVAFLISAIPTGAWASEQAQTFLDVPSTHWAQSYIESVTEKGIMKGAGDGTFQPEKSLTKAELVQILYNLYGDGYRYDTNAGAPTLFDVQPNDWYYHPVYWHSTEMVTGNLAASAQDGMYFYPNTTAARWMVVVALEEFAGRLPRVHDPIAFPDMEGASQIELSWMVHSSLNLSAEERALRTKNQMTQITRSLSILQQADIISGFPDGTFGPDEPITRAQMAKIIDTFTDAADVFAQKADAQGRLHFDEFATGSELFEQVIPYAQSLNYTYSTFEFQIYNTKQLSLDLCNENFTIRIVFSNHEIPVDSDCWVLIYVPDDAASTTKYTAEYYSENLGTRMMNQPVNTLESIFDILSTYAS